MVRASHIYNLGNRIKLIERDLATRTLMCPPGRRKTTETELPASQVTFNGNNNQQQVVGSSENDN